MVKRQKEKQYQSHREYTALRAEGSLSSSRGATGSRRPLPFSHCALSLTPFQHPVCTSEGVIFDSESILPFVMKYQRDPCTGKSMTSRDLIQLQIDQNDEGEWQCPVLTKAFANHTKIVAIRHGSNANVYSYEAYHELNVKPRNYEDLISGEKFDRKKDVMILNDPNDEELNRRRDINQFYHIRNPNEFENLLAQSSETSIRHSMTAERVMQKLSKKKTESEQKSAVATALQGPQPGQPKQTINASRKRKILAQDVTGVTFNTSAGSASFTSTGVNLAKDSQAREATDEEILQAELNAMRKLKKKGYVRINTSMGKLAFELHCDIAPRTCYNFLGLCERGDYDGSSFHRLIPNFMIQGGKPSDGDGEANGEENSFWGDSFADEFDDRLTHTGKGVVSMANAGPNTNRRQFFLTFKSCSHLDRKHSIFGVVVEGMDVLQSMEKIPTDKKSCPTQRIQIESVEILQNPVHEAKELEMKRLDRILAQREKGQKPTKKAKQLKRGETDGPVEVGHYLRAKLQSRSQMKDGAIVDASLKSSKVPTKTSFKDFSGW